MKSSIEHCEIVNLPKNHNRAGNITVIENQANAPFAIKRIYYLYDVPGGETRGGHAHKELEQLFVAASGAFDVKIDDGVNTKIIRLDRPYFGLHVVAGIWSELVNFSSGSICLVLASDFYKADDYIRDYAKYKEFKNEI